MSLESVRTPFGVRDDLTKGPTLQRSLLVI